MHQERGGSSAVASRTLRRHGWKLAAVASAASVLVGAVTQFGQVVHVGAVDNTGMFEMDGNIVHDAATTPPYDWASLFGASGQRLVTPDAVNGPVYGDQWLDDSAVPDNSYFTENGAGVKDIDTLNNWGCKVQNNPLAKDDLLHAYAALVQIPAGAPDNAGHTVLYLGSERGSNNGTSFAGFWLFKDSSVGCNLAAGAFNGQHSVGDLLVVSDYTNGGTNQDVSVYKWVGGSNPLTLVLSGGVCPQPPTGTSSEAACAIANTAAISAPWSSTQLPSNTFVEAGIDLTQLFSNIGSECFTTFLAETRSSNQLTATLKDFSGGQLSTCIAPAVATTATPGGSTVAPGAAQHDVATIATPPNHPAPAGTITFTLCGPTDVTSAGCPQGKGTAVGSPVTISAGSATSANVNTPASPLATGTYCWGSLYTPDPSQTGLYLASYHSDSSAECFTVVKNQPTISTQIAVTGNGDLGSTSFGDTATLKNTFGSPASGEVVTFKLWGPFGAGVTPSCTGTPKFTTTGALSGSGGTWTATTSQTYTPTAVGTYVWTASYADDAFNLPVSGSCTDANESGAISTPNLSITKTADPNPVSAGSPIGFTITVSNGTGAGTSTALGVTINDPLPAGPGIDWSVAAGGPANCTIGGSVGSQTLSCTAVNLAPGASESVHVVSGTAFASCNTYQNTASASQTNPARTITAGASTTVLCPDLKITKSADHATVSAGSSIGFTVNVSNGGAGRATAVTLSDPLPAGPAGSLVSWSVSPAYAGPGSCSVTGAAGSQTLSCSFGDMAPGATASVHVTSATSYVSCGVYNNTAQLSSTNEPSPIPSNLATTTVQCPALTLTKTADSASVSAGSAIGFTVTVSNSSAAGTGTATAVTLSDPLPAGSGIDWAISPAYAGPGTCTVGGSVGSQTLSCSFGDMAPGASASVHVSSGTDQTSCASYHNVATVDATNHPELKRSADTAVDCPGLSVTKKADAATVSAGSTIGFTVTVSNSSAAGTGTATAVSLNDPLPSGSGVDWAISPAYSGPGTCTINGSAGNQTLACSFGDMAPGATASVHISSGTNAGSCGAYPNSATVSGTNSGTIPPAQASTTVQCPALTVHKTADASPVTAGTAIGFTVTVANSSAQGTGTATAVTLSDPLPAGQGVSWAISPAYSGPGTCTVNGTAGSQTLSCSFGDMAPGATASVHVSSATFFVSCGSYPNSATVSATNSGTIPPAQASITVQCPALSINKTADASPVSAGTGIGFTVTVGNSSAAGTGTATAVTLSDPLPAGSGVDWAISPAYSGPGTCSISGGVGHQTLSCSFGDMAPGASASIHITSATQFASCGAYPNSATVSATNSDDIPPAQASITVQCPGLSITKTADHGSVSAGSPIGFTVTVTNSSAAGTGTATNVTVNDPLPAGSGVDWSISPAYSGPGTCSVGGSAGSQTLSCSFGDMAPGATASVHISSATQFASCKAYPNSATVSAGNSGTVPPAQATTTVDCPVISITKHADATPVSTGTNIGFTVTVSNSAAAGTGTATGVTVDDPLPAGTDVSWAISPAYAGQGTCSVTGSAPHQDLQCSLGDMAPGASISVHIQSTTDFASAGTYPNTATASATNAPSVNASATIVVLAPDLSITKTADATPVSVGSLIGFTVTVSNADAENTGTAAGVVLDDPLPAGTDVSWAISPAYTGQGTCAINGTAPTQTLHCDLGSMAPGASISVHIQSTTDFASAGTYPNTATATATNAPSVNASATIVVLAPALSITKTADASPVNTGTPIGFTVTVSNSAAAGTGTATAVAINDPLPPGAGVDWSISPAYSGPGTCSIGGAVGSQTLSCSLGDMAPGASASVHIASATTNDSAGTYPNTATATSTNNPPVSATAEIVVQKPGLNIAKTADATAVPSGSAVGFTVTVSNTGAGAATAATLSDPLPSASGVSWSISPAYAGPGTCSISSGSSGQTLSCSFGDLASGAVVKIHVTSATTDASCGSLPNTATASASNAPAVNASASTVVTCVLGIVAPPNTGADVPWREGLALVITGLGVIAILGRRRETEPQED